MCYLINFAYYLISTFMLKETEAFLKANVNILSDEEMGKRLGFTSGTIRHYRSRFKIKKIRTPTPFNPDKDLVVKCLTMFANGSTVADICRACEINMWLANKMIDRFWLTKRKTEQTETITLQSKL